MIAFQVQSKTQFFQQVDRLICIKFKFYSYLFLSSMIDVASKKGQISRENGCLQQDHRLLSLPTLSSNPGEGILNSISPMLDTILSTNGKVYLHGLCRNGTLFLKQYAFISAIPVTLSYAQYQGKIRGTYRSCTFLDISIIISFGFNK